MSTCVFCKTKQSKYCGRSFHKFPVKDVFRLAVPSESVINIASVADKMFRHAVNCNQGLPPVEPQFPGILCLQILKSLLQNPLENLIFSELDAHIFDDAPDELSNHVYQLTKSVIKEYIELRMFALTKIATLRQTGLNIRHYTNRQLVWANQ